MKKSLKESLSIGITLLLLVSTGNNLDINIHAKHYHNHVHRIYKHHRHHRIHRHHKTTKKQQHKKRRHKPSSKHKHITKLQKHYLNKLIKVMGWEGITYPKAKKLGWNILTSNSLMSNHLMFGLTDGERLILQEYQRANSKLQNYDKTQAHKLEHNIVNVINQNRINNGDNPLTVNPDLQHEAESQAKEVDRTDGIAGDYAYNFAGGSYKHMAKIYAKQLGSGKANDTQIGIGAYYGSNNGWNVVEITV